MGQKFLHTHSRQSNTQAIVADARKKDRYRRALLECRYYCHGVPQDAVTEVTVCYSALSGSCHSTWAAWIPSTTARSNPKYSFFATSMNRMGFPGPSPGVPGPPLPSPSPPGPPLVPAPAPPAPAPSPAPAPVPGCNPSGCCACPEAPGAPGGAPPLRQTRENHEGVAVDVRAKDAEAEPGAESGGGPPTGTAAGTPLAEGGAPPAPLGGAAPAVVYPGGGGVPAAGVPCACKTGVPCAGG